MNLSNDGTKHLPKAGFDWFALKVIFQGQKGLNLPLFSNFATYCPFIQNLFSNFSFIVMKLPQDGDNELWREGFNKIILIVITKIKKVNLAHFHIFLYINQ